MAEQMTAVFDGVATKFEIVQVISECKKRGGRKDSKYTRPAMGMKRVMAVIRAGRRTETRFIDIPR